LGPERCIRLRIGLHLGDVIFDDGDVYGTGVNIAVRLQTIASPGGICISGTAAEHLSSMPGLAMRYLGWQELKNLARPVEVYEIGLRDDASNRPAPFSPAEQRRSPALRLPDVPRDRPSV